MPDEKKRQRPNPTYKERYRRIYGTPAEHKKRQRSLSGKGHDFMGGLKSIAHKVGKRLGMGNVKEATRRAARR